MKKYSAAFLFCLLILCIILSGCDSDSSSGNDDLVFEGFNADMSPSPGEFSVGPSNKVQFARGNLQALFNGNSYEWGFASHQYTYIGNQDGNINGNKSIDSQKPGRMVDLFSWSGPSSKYGICTSTDSGTYSGSFKDWGEVIDHANTWETLSAGPDSQWEYLLEHRTHAADLWGFGRINVKEDKYVNGLILLPDDWVLPADCQFFPGANFNYETNKYDLAKWTKMENAGAIFLPVTDTRYGKDCFEDGLYGHYWSSSIYYDTDAYKLKFNGITFEDGDHVACPNGYGVRLVHFVTP